MHFGSLTYLYRLNQPRISFINSPLYLGTSLERGRVRKDVFGSSSGPDATDWLWAGSVFLGWDTPLGPLYFGLGMAQDSQGSTMRYICRSDKAINLVIFADILLLAVL